MRRILVCQDCPHCRGEDGWVGAAVLHCGNDSAKRRVYRDNIAPFCGLPHKDLYVVLNQVELPT